MAAEEKVVFRQERELTLKWLHAIDMLSSTIENLLGILRVSSDWQRQARPGCEAGAVHNPGSHAHTGLTFMPVGDYRPTQ